MRQKNVLQLTRAAMIAALYVALTLLANMLGLANGAVQLRFSEALAILPYFTAAAIPGLTAGCLLANLITGCAMPDVIFGALATLIGALGTYRLRKHKWLASLPPVAANAVIVPLVLRYVYGIRPLWLSFLTVTAGEFLSCSLLGTLLLLALEKHRARLFS